MNGVSTGGTPVPIAAVGVVAYDGSGNIAGPGGLPGYYTDQSVGDNYSRSAMANGTYATDSLGRVTVNLPGRSQPAGVVPGGFGHGVRGGYGRHGHVGHDQVQTIPASGSFGVQNFLGSYLAGRLRRCCRR